MITQLDPWNPTSGLHAIHPYDTEVEYCKILQWLIISNNLKVILELGRFKGHSTEMFLEAARKIDGFVDSVDIEDVSLIADNRLKKHDCSTDEFFATNKDKYDFIYIDAGHTYNCAMRDIMNASLALKPGGFIAIHDTGYNDPPLAEVKRALGDAIEKIGGEWMHLVQGKGISIGQF